MPGSSTRNTRIERMWVEVGTQFAYRWRAFFTRLERRHQLDPSNPAHLWLLHLLFLDALNADCDEFRTQWNHHPISGKGKDRSPLVGPSYNQWYTLNINYISGYASPRAAQAGNTS